MHYIRKKLSKNKTNQSALHEAMERMENIFLIKFKYFPRVRQSACCSSLELWYYVKNGHDNH